MAHLNPAVAKWHLYELEEREDDLREIDFSDRGNVDTRLTHLTNESTAYERFADAITKIQHLMPEAEIAVLSSAEIAFRCHGLEFARAHLAHDMHSFQSRPEIVFGVGFHETVLMEHNAEALRQIIRSIGEVRHSDRPRDHPLWRLHSERWLESLVVLRMAAVDGRLDPRVAWHHQRGEFQRFGYFPQRELSSALPLLLLVAPAFHVHPATDTLLRYISPKIDWTLIGIDERWRENVRVIFRKNPQRSDSREINQNVA